MGHTYVVPFFLEPVKGLLGTKSTVSRGVLHLPILWVGTAPTSHLGLCKRDIRRGSRDIALETIHVV